MKKLIATFLCVLILLSYVSISGIAVSETQGMDALKAQFKHGDSVLDYVYYSPAGKNDDEKYPLVVWLHGNSSGDYPGHQLDNCSIGLWSSEEYQSRFKDSGGAYLLLPRYSTSGIIDIAWEGTTSNLKRTIDDFIKKHIDNIDINRIYIGGYSMGGKMTLRMAMDYPAFFAAAFPLSPVYDPSNSDLNNLMDMPIWLSWCKNDNYLSLSPTTVNSNWQYLMSISNCKADCRIATFDTIYNYDYTVKMADGSKDVHNTWDAACHDMFMNDNRAQKGIMIKDGNGKTVVLTYPQGLIYWMSCQSNEVEEEETQERRTIMDILKGFIEIIKEAFVEILTAIGK